MKADTKAIQAIGTHVITHNQRVKVSQEDRHKYHLHIINTTLDESGPYMCQLNTQPMISQMGILTVYQPADIVRVSELSGVVEGGEARLKCEAEGYPPPAIYWTREEKGHMITLRDRHSGKKKELRRVQGSTLVLSKVKRSQMGNYLCIASNGFRPAVSRRVRLNVNFRPVINVQDQKVYARPGQKVTLECVIEAFPLGIYYWELHTGNILSESNSKYSMGKFQIGEYKTRSQLIISDFTEEDVGIYKCICKNAMNSNNDRVEGLIYLNMYQERTDPPTIASTAFFERGDLYSVLLGQDDSSLSTAYYASTPPGYDSEERNIYKPYQESYNYDSGNYPNGVESSDTNQQAKSNKKPTYLDHLNSANRRASCLSASLLFLLPILGTF